MNHYGTKNLALTAMLNYGNMIQRFWRACRIRRGDVTRDLFRYGLMVRDRATVHTPEDVDAAEA